MNLQTHTTRSLRLAVPLLGVLVGLFTFWPSGPARGQVNSTLVVVSAASYASALAPEAIAAAFGAGLRARVIKQDVPHHLCRQPEEMRAILPIHLLVFEQTDKRFVDKRRRLQRMACVFAAHVAMRQPVQFGVDQRRQAFECRRITSAPSLQQFRHQL